jgi:ribosomal protein S18 acetylase RimI-like enzyme
VWQGAGPIVLRGADSPPALARYLARNPGCSFVAEADGALVGVSLAGHDGRRGYLHHVAVDPAFRRRGVGTGLVERCLAALRAEGMEKVQLFVFHANAGGWKFWERLGWRERPDVALMSVLLTDDPNA